MTIIIITQSINPIVNAVFASKYEVIGLIENGPRKSKIDTKKSISRWCIDKIKSATSRNTSSLKELCERKKIPYCFMNRSDDPGLKEWINDLKPDLIVVYSMSSLLKPELFEIPKYGTINIHPSYLPEYRGPKPCFWQYHDTILNSGVTVHYIDKGEDTGDIILQERVSISLGQRNKERIHQIIGVVGVKLLSKTLDLIARGEVSRIVQPKDSPTRRSRLIKEEEHESIIDWENWHVERVWHFLRGTEDWLNALPQPTGIYAGSRWSIGNFFADESKNRLGKIFKENGKYFVKSKEAKIELLRPKFKLMRLLKSKFLKS